MGGMAPLTPDPDRIAHYRERFGGKPATYVIGVLAGRITAIAARHSQTCSGCATCYELTVALSAVAALEIEHGPPPDDLWDTLRSP
jgi:hypothetical protein